MGQGKKRPIQRGIPLERCVVMGYVVKWFRQNGEIVEKKRVKRYEDAIRVMDSITDEILEDNGRDGYVALVS